MKFIKPLIIFLMIAKASVVFAQEEKKFIKKGNEQYKDKNYKEAEQSYRQSVTKTDKTVEGNFNLGDALYKEKKFDEAREQFDKIASASKNKLLMANAYHNIGNSFLEKKKLEESIAAYKKSLLNNPTDDETRYNLSYAQKMLKKQQDDKKKQDKKNKDDKKKDKDKDKKDNNKDDKNQDKKDQDKKDQDKKNQDKKDQNDKQNQPQPDNVSKDDAERMLEALNNDEKKTQDKLKNKKPTGERVKILKDW